MKQSTIRKCISLAMILVLAIVFSISSNLFFTTNNIIAIFRDMSVIGMIGVGLTFVVLTGGIDLSTGSMMGFVGMVMANVYQYTVLPIWAMLLCGLLTGILAGFFNGWIITKFQLPEFIATLSSLGIFRALTYIIAIKKNGLITSQAMKVESFTRLGSGIAGIYYVIIVFILMVLIGQIILKFTRFGIHLYASGSNVKAARLSGINIEKTRILAYISVGLCVGIATIFQTARMQSTTALLGDGMEFNVIAAVVVGGCALDGGRGDVIGTFLGALFMATLNSGIYKFQINTSYQLIIKGIIIICVVIFDSWYNHRTVRMAKPRKNKEVAL
jgi:Ribose/xylose/arabinose/galactoside ABC-type transport systems, permease components